MEGEISARDGVINPIKAHCSEKCCLLRLQHDGARKGYCPKPPALNSSISRFMRGHLYFHPYLRLSKRE